MRQGIFLFTISEYWWITTHQVRQVSDRPTYPKSQYVKQYVSNCIYIYIHMGTNIFSTHTQIQINTVLTCGTPPETNIRKAENEDLDDFGFQGDGHNSTVKMVRILSLATFSKIKSSSQIGNQINQFHSPKIRKMRSKRAFASSSSASTSHSLHSWHWKKHIRGWRQCAEFIQCCQTILPLEQILIYNSWCIASFGGN